MSLLFNALQEEAGRSSPGRGGASRGGKLQVRLPREDQAASAGWGGGPHDRRGEGPLSCRCSWQEAEGLRQGTSNALQLNVIAHLCCEHLLRRIVCIVKNNNNNFCNLLTRFCQNGSRSLKKARLSWKLHRRSPDLWAQSCSSSRMLTKRHWIIWKRSRERTRTSRVRLIYILKRYLYVHYHLTLPI